MSSKQQTGQRGEQIASEYLQQRGYSILERNWQRPYGEIDIIARHQDILVFVEVRTRRSTENAFESIQPRKQQRLKKLAFAYLHAHRLEDTEWRIDVIAVALYPKTIIEHVEDALGW